jgi:predicted small lipoprotein YifL
MMMKHVTMLVLLLTLLVTNGCGQSGALYLPDHVPVPEHDGHQPGASKVTA